MSVSQFDLRIPEKGKIMQNELYQDYKIGLLTFFARNIEHPEQHPFGDDTILDDLTELPQSLIQSDDGSYCPDDTLSSREMLKLRIKEYASQEIQNFDELLIELHLTLHNYKKQKVSLELYVQLLFMQKIYDENKGQSSVSAQKEDLKQQKVSNQFSTKQTWADYMLWLSNIWPISSLRSSSTQAEGNNKLKQD